MQTCWRWPAGVQTEHQNGGERETEVTLNVVKVVVGDQTGCWSESLTNCCWSTGSSTTSHPPLGSLGVFTQLICTLQLWSMTCLCLQMMLFDEHWKGWAGDDCSHRCRLLVLIIAVIFFFTYLNHRSLVSYLFENSAAWLLTGSIQLTPQRF